MTEKPPEDDLALANFIVLSRIYDVLVGLYAEENRDKAAKLVETHLRGNLLMPAPEFVGNFLTSELNKEGPAAES